MTENEAVIQLNFDMEMIRFNPSTGESLTLEQIKAHNEDNYKTYLADELAITALLEIQQYRKLGTVEEVKYLVDSYNGMIHDFGDDMSALEQYRATGTIEEFKALKEKNVAKKPIIQGLGQRYCPVCKCGGADHFYCARCGQKLG